VTVGVLGLLAGRYLLGLRRRTHVAAVSAVTFTTMALGAAALIITLALLEGFQSTIRAQLMASGVHAELRPEKGNTLPAGAWIEHLARRHPELEVRAVRRGAVWVLGGGSAAPATLEIGGEESQVEINRVLAARLGIGAGSELTVASARQVLTPLGPMPLRRRMVVTRVVAARPGEEEALVRVPPAVGSGLLASAAPQVVELRARDPAHAWDVASSIRTGIPAGVEVVSFRELNRPLLAALQLERVMIGFGVGLVIVVAALNLLCNLALLAAEKRADVALLAAMGLRPGRVRRLFVTLGLGVGALGGVLGTLVGGAAAGLLDAFRLLPLPKGVFIVSHVPFTVTPQSVAVVLGVSLAAALLASLAPARAAARRDVLEGLRYE
jgi:lipoprotein-releasing system permease protein